MNSSYISRLFFYNLFIVFFIFSPFFSQAQSNITLQSQYPFVGEEMNDIWGYEVNGFEYAIALTTNGTYIINVSDPTLPVLEVFVDGPNSTWRDAKTWGNYAYMTNENNGGMQIIDMSALPGGVINPLTDVYTWTGGPWNNGTVNFSSAHNIYIDENGIGYIIGANYGVGGCIMVDLTVDPINPPIVGIYNTRYVHDAFVRGDTLWTGEINNGIFSVVDVSDKANPVVLGTQSTTDNFTHNIWLSDDGQTAFTTDEVGGAVIGAYDVSDPEDIQLLDTYQSNPGQGAIEHNVFVKDDFLIISYYADGVVIVDASKPKKMVETGNYDTSPTVGGVFNGCWGVYPYLPSGTILASDIELGLFVLSPTYVEACFLEGLVTDAVSGMGLNEVSITVIEDNSGNEMTEFGGDYLTGVAVAGTYTVTFFKSGYVPQTVTVSLTNGLTELLNVALVPVVPLVLTGQITDISTGIGISGAEVLADNGFEQFSTVCDGNGFYSFVLPGAGTYDVYAGKWGYVNRAKAPEFYDVTNNMANLALELGYYDDFLFDFNWTENGNANTGNWERGIPNGTNYNGVFSNPNEDVTNDIGLQCYVTGNTAGGGAGNDDVDGGSTFLTSPSFDVAAYFEPQITYSTWFFNDGGNTTQDDTLFVKLNNGIDLVVIDTLTNDDAEGVWTERTITISDYLTPTANMLFQLEIGDLNEGHLVEGGLDLFRVTDIVPPVNVQIQCWLEGTYDVNTGMMTTELQANDLVPLQQPYNRAPWNYQGTESVASVSANVVDWVLVEARFAQNNHEIVESRAALLMSNGMVHDLDGSVGVTFTSLTTNADYYLVIRHRNHLAVLSSQIVSLPNAVAYDFTLPANVEGEEQLADLLDGEFGLRAGDFNSDGLLSVADFNFYQTQTALINDYVDGDCNLDRSVTVADFNLYLPNSSVIGVEQVRY